MKGEIQGIVKLRGVAALMVLFFHLICLSDGYVSNAILLAIFSIGRYGVELFFVISGFIITHSLIRSGYRFKNLPVFLLKRVVRIEPPYLVVVALFVCYHYLRTKIGFGTGNLQIVSPWQVLLHIGYLIPFSSYNWLSVVFWTLGVEFQFYLILAVSFEWVIKNIFIRYVVVGLLLTGQLLLHNPNFIFHWCPVFLTGIFLALYSNGKIGFKEFAVTSCLLFVFIFIRLELKTLIFSLIPFLVIWFKLDVRSRILNFFGEISYSVYLSHTLIVFPIVSFGIRNFQTLLGKVAVLSAAVLLTVGCSYLLYIFVEKPSKKMSSSIKYSNT